MKLEPTELAQVQQALQGYSPAQSAIDTLVEEDGDLDTSLEILLRSQTSPQIVQMGDRLCLKFSKLN